MEEKINFKCPNCGGALEFNSAVQKLKCPHCDGEFDVDSFNEEKGFTVENEKFDDDELVTYTCDACGGVIMTDKDTVATSCPYCGNPVVLKGRVTGDYKPSRIIPFKLDKKQAQEKYLEHLKGKTLLPDAFRSQAVIDEIKGIYVPYWLFDGTANASIWYDATKVRTWSDPEFNYTETSYFKLFRSGRVSFDDVPVDASSKIDDQISQSIEPFDMNQSENYNNNYLAGYLADKYDVDVEKSREVANSRIVNSTYAMFDSTTAGFTTCVPSNRRMGIANGSQEYVMLPMWLLNVKYQGKNYTFAMNGQTGKFVGDLPYDQGKLVKYMVIVFAVVTALITAAQYMMYR